MGIAAGAAALLLLLGAPAALAVGTVTITGTAPNKTLQFTAGASDSNTITVSQSGSIFTIIDGGATMTESNASCTGDGTGAVTCTDAAITRIGAMLNDGADSITNNTNAGSNFDGGPGDDTLVGSQVNDIALAGGDGNDTIDGRAGNDGALGGDLGADRISGGSGTDSLRGSTVTDSLADGNDVLEGGVGVDTLNGGAGSDMLAGGADIDMLNGGQDADVVHGDDGDDRMQEDRDDAADQLFGDAGDDFWVIDRFPFGATHGPDVSDGGAGVDRVVFTDISFIFFGTPSPPARVTLEDALANDGFEDQPMTLLGIEDVEISGEVVSEDVLRGDAGANELRAAQGDDDVDGRAGNDAVFLASGDDRVEARDGFYDRVACGPGADTAAADQLDDLSDCETVTRDFVQPNGIGPAVQLPPATPPEVAPPVTPATPVPITVPADTAAPRCTMSAPQTVADVRRGISVSQSCDEPSMLAMTLTADVRRVGRAARVGDLVLTERSLSMQAGTRRVRLSIPARLRRRLGRRATLRLRAEAIDAAGNRSATSRVIRLRRGR